MWFKYHFSFVVLLFFVSVLVLPSYSADLPTMDPLEPALATDNIVSIDNSGYLSPSDFFALEDDFSISVLAVQTSPNSPVTSSTGLKGVLISLFGPYDPVITQLRYQSNTSTNYTYVNDIAPDYPWLCSAGLFTVMIFALMRIWGAVLCRQ